MIVTIFAPVAQPCNHGHHNASALLAVEAFKRAGDPKAFPEQIAEGLAPWQPTRIVQDRGNGLTISGGSTNPATGETVQAIAARTSAQHKTQGVGGGFGRGGGGGNGNFSAGFNLLDGASGTNLMEGVDTTWARVPNGGAEITKLADEAIAQFKPEDPAASVPALLKIRSQIAELPSDPVVNEKSHLLDSILQACLGLSVATVAPAVEIVPGEQLKLHYSAVVTSRVPVRLVEVRAVNLGAKKLDALISRPERRRPAT